MKNIFKKTIECALLASLAISYSLNLAAAAKQDGKVDVSRISIEIRQAFDVLQHEGDALSKEKGVFVSGMSVVEPNSNHDAVFNTFKLSFSVGLIGCASVLVEGKVAGVMFYSQDEDTPQAYELDYLVIDKDFQKKGVGSRAIELFAQEVKARTIKLKPRADNKSFYKKIGFKDTGTSYYVKKYAS